MIHNKGRPFARPTIRRSDKSWDDRSLGGDDELAQAGAMGPEPQQRPQPTLYRQESINM